MQALISLRGIRKEYPTPAGRYLALDAIDLEIPAGELVALVGRSGSGKSTLLNVLGGIDRPSGGEAVVGGEALHSLSESGLSRWRGRSVGIVFQFFQLLPSLTAAENVMLPMDFAGRGSGTERRARALALLAELGIADQADKLPATLSGGQQQRVAVARALANDPPIVLADEPTGNLDSRSARDLIALLGAVVREGRTVIVATHDRAALAHASRTVSLTDGRIETARANG
ncbi:MAG TPA: ABC transporter ATP-binding protein [Usitatibacter sp.]|jgi:putative ABC transport system ATP-binding protein|nr:ABC transporter ATP-binding protein [Usitatibacter sp.]